MILGIDFTNEKRRYNVTSTLIGWAHTLNDPGLCIHNIVMGYTLYMDRIHYMLNSLWPGDATWRHISGSALVHVMACCLTTPSHYPHQYWLLVSGISWRPSMGSSIANTLSTIIYKEFENYTAPMANEGKLEIYDHISSHIHIYPDMCIYIGIRTYIYAPIDTHKHTYRTNVSITISPRHSQIKLVANP